MSDQIDLAELKILDLRLWVHLGCSAEERLNPQMVSINVHFVFLKAPQGAYTDNINDSICYRRAVELVKETTDSKEFNLIEHCCVSIYNALLDYVKQLEYHDLQIKVIVTKMSPPVPGVYGGVSFSYSGK